MSHPNDFLCDNNIVNSAGIMVTNCGSWYLDRPWLTARHACHYDIGCDSVGNSRDGNGMFLLIKSTEALGG